MMHVIRVDKVLVMSAPGYGREFANCTVLVVEDMAANRKLVKAMLEMMGVGTVETARDGQEGLERLPSVIPDMIILDIMMPRMDGLEFLGRLRTDPVHGDIPVLVATALDDKADRAAAFDAGASDYLAKPLDQREFTARVSVHLRTRMLIGRLRRYQDRLGRDLEAAQSMQVDLLPSPAIMAGMEGAYNVHISSVFRSSSELGGDLWGLIPLDADRFGLYLVDFSGHGIAAAINTFRLHMMMEKKRDVADDPAALLGRVNVALLKVLQRGQFATMSYAVFDMAAHRVTFASASAPAPAHRLPDGSARLSPVNSLPLGFLPDAAYENVALDFPPGSGMLLYSDGLSEAVDGDGNYLGENAARWIAEMTTGDLTSEVEVLLFRGCNFHDDLTAVWVMAK
jgi:sigma-B regulation protein RsbU (phosphoserine phosphatase)